ncbi:hypothetical protein [Quatrionicoccus australiensis]|uniref:hypothetical protein n=1 Tax=Quatrionicoccus australiensis TaxID=138118 RepID=UPI001CF90EE3|nr:hypothetical protein [Quatrionicoccus australiensis]UCV16726.1 hypothetical protein KI612_08685 [Quatrionicoccus australiensis]
MGNAIKLGIEIDNELSVAVANFNAGVKECAARRLRAKKLAEELGKAEKKKVELGANLAAVDSACGKAETTEEMSSLKNKALSIKAELESIKAVIVNLQEKKSQSSSRWDGGYLEADHDKRHLQNLVFRCIRQRLLEKLKKDTEFVELLKCIYVVANEAEDEILYKDRHAIEFMFGVENSLVDVGAEILSDDQQQIKSEILAEIGCVIPGLREKN